MSDFAFLSQTSFLRAAPAVDQPLAVAGVAWDGSTTNRPGARMAPRSIREASHMLCDGTHPWFGCAPGTQLGDAGDLPLPNTSLERMRDAIADPDGGARGGAGASWSAQRDGGCVGGASRRARRGGFGAA